MTRVDGWLAIPATTRAVAVLLTQLGPQRSEHLDHAVVGGSAAADAMIAAGSLVQDDNGVVSVTAATAEYVRAAVMAIALHDATTAANRRRRAPATTAEVVVRIVTALADHGAMTYSALSRRHVSTRQRVVLDAALSQAIEAGAVRRVPGQRFAVADAEAVGVTPEDVEAARRRRAGRDGKFAGRGEAK